MHRVLPYTVRLDVPAREFCRNTINPSWTSPSCRLEVAATATSSAVRYLLSKYFLRIHRSGHSSAFHLHRARGLLFVPYVASVFINAEHAPRNHTRSIIGCSGVQPLPNTLQSRKACIAEQHPLRIYILGLASSSYLLERLNLYIYISSIVTRYLPKPLNT